jgi:site-specific recombinase XerD
MSLLEQGVDITIIALLLGHEQVSTTWGIYIHADMGQKERALAALCSDATKPGRYHPPDSLLAFLEAL